MKAKANLIGKTLLAAAMFGGLVSAPIAAEAQWDRDRRDLGLPRQYSGGVKRIIERLEHDSNSFRSAVERNKWDDRYDRDDRRPRDRNRRDDYFYDRRNSGDRYRFDEFKRMVQRFDEEVEDLRKTFNRTDYWLDTRAQVNQVIRMARPIERMMDDRRRYDSGIQERWHRVAADLSALSGLMGADRL